MIMKFYQFSKLFKLHVETYGTTPEPTNNILQVQMKPSENVQKNDDENV